MDEAETSDAKNAGQLAKASGKSAPVLPWMRVPITIGEGGVALDKISGLSPELASAIRKRA